VTGFAPEMYSASKVGSPLTEFCGFASFGYDRLSAVRVGTASRAVTGDEIMPEY
jgi:hypothetical protein